jgi:hypothetical protein
VPPNDARKARIALATERLHPGMASAKGYRTKSTRIRYMKRTFIYLGLLVLGTSGVSLFGQRAVSDRQFRMGREQFERRRIDPAPQPEVTPTNTFWLNRAVNPNTPLPAPPMRTNTFLPTNASVPSIGSNVFTTNVLKVARPSYVTITNHGRIMPVVVTPSRQGTNVQSGSNRSAGAVSATAQLTPAPTTQSAPTSQNESPPPAPERER